MRLYTNPASPFGRKVKVLAHEVGLFDRLEIVNETLSPVAPSEAVSSVNPLGKIPCLVLEDGTVLYDSRVVCEVLDGMHGGSPAFPPTGPARTRALVLQALGDGILDAAVGRRYETVLRPEPLRWPDWVEGQKRKIRAGLDRLEAEAHRLTDLDEIGSITAACVLGYLDFRYADEPWRADCPGLAAWFERVEARPSMRRTAPA